MTKSLLERRKEVERQEVLSEQKRKENAKKRVANRILKGFDNPKLIEIIEETLVKEGRTYVTGFGCLCQGGFCSDTKGFPMYSQDFESEWIDKGAMVSYSIPGVYLRIKDASIKKSSIPHIHHETLKITYGF